MSIGNAAKKRRAIFLFIALYVLGFAGYLGLCCLSHESSGMPGLLWADYFLAVVLPFIVLAGPAYYSFLKKEERADD